MLFSIFTFIFVIGFVVLFGEMMLVFNRDRQPEVLKPSDNRGEFKSNAERQFERPTKFGE